MNARRSSGSWLKVGCMTSLALALVAAIVLGVAVGLAVRQNRSAIFEHEAQVLALPDMPPPEAAARPVRLKLDVHTAAVSIKPIGAGESIRVESDYDPRLYRLSQRVEQDDRGDVLIVELRPLGSTLMALLRVKIGGRLAKLRVALPRGVPLELEGALKRSFGVMELGGLSATSVRLDIEDGGIKVSFAEPLAAPMDLLRIIGNRGSLSVVGLGNASPRESVLFQHIGAMDLDLRGAWSRDAQVRVIGGGAGGSIWLPDNVNIIGLNDRPDVRDLELPRPTLDLSIKERLGRFVVID